MFVRLAAAPLHTAHVTITQEAAVRPPSLR